MKELHELVGAIHIHTTFSDGTGHYADVIRQASEVGLEFLLFSDHNTLEPKRMGREGFHNGMLVGIGYEINDRDLHNHLLAFQIDDEVCNGLDPVEYTRRVVAAGGWAVVAHPDERRNRLKEFPPYPWTAWESNDFQAMEIWNALSEWMEKLTQHNKFWLYLNPRRSVTAPTQWTLEKWDQLNAGRRVVGTGGVDVHAHHYPIWRNLSVVIFPYKVQFRSIQSHVLLEEPPDKNDGASALRQLFTALRSGRVFVSNRYVGDARGFRFWAEDEKNGPAVYQMGDRLPAGSQVRFEVKLPAEATQAILLKDSKPVGRCRDDAFKCLSEGPGVYRIEVRKGRRAFIYSNPIVIEAA
ncbi:MAG: CehA/McbA family metallohydrolase [bacterium]|nr:CehA/McbA family metallohydrolase [bacterium]